MSDFVIQCPFCRTEFTVERNCEIRCESCGGTYEVTIKETMRHQEDIFPKGSTRAYVEGIEGRRRV